MGSHDKFCVTCNHWGNHDSADHLAGTADIEARAAEVAIAAVHALELRESDPSVEQYAHELVSALAAEGLLVDRMYDDALREVSRLAAELTEVKAELSQWKDRMWATVHERAVWQHDLGEHTGDLPFMHCPECWRIEAVRRAEQAEAECERLRGVCNDWGSNYQSWVDATEKAEQQYADLVARVQALADEWTSGNDETCQHAPAYGYMLRALLEGDQ